MSLERILIYGNNNCIDFPNWFIIKKNGLLGWNRCFRLTVLIFKVKCCFDYDRIFFWLYGQPCVLYLTTSLECVRARTWTAAAPFACRRKQPELLKQERWHFWVTTSEILPSPGLSVPAAAWTASPGRWMSPGCRCMCVFESVTTEAAPRPKDKFLC